RTLRGKAPLSTVRGVSATTSGPLAEEQGMERPLTRKGGLRECRVGGRSRGASRLARFLAIGEPAVLLEDPPGPFGHVCRWRVWVVGAVADVVAQDSGGFARVAFAHDDGRQVEP